MTKGKYRRIALPGIGQPYMRPTREPVELLNPYAMQGQGGNPGLADQMVAGWARCATHMNNLRNALAAARLAFERCGEDETLAEGNFRDDLTSLLSRAWVDHSNNPQPQGAGAVAEWCLYHYWLYGISVGNIRWVADHGATDRKWSVLDGMGIEVYPIHPSTIMRWQQDANLRRLESVVQSAVNGTATIPAADLIWVQRGGALGEYAGVSLLRPAAWLFARWKAIWVAAERASVNSGGVLLVTSDESYGSAAYTRMRQSLNDWQNGQSPFVMASGKWNLQFVSPSASSGDMDQIEKLNEDLDNMLGGAVTALISSASGRHLGEVAANEEAKQAQEDMTVMVRTWGSRFAQWVATEIGYTGRLPILSVTPADATTSRVETATAVLAAKAAGALTWQPQDEAWLRNVYGLDPLAQPSVESAADPTVADMAEDDPVPPGAVADEAANGLLAWRASPVAAKGLQYGPDRELAKRIAARQPLSQLELRTLRQWFRQAGDITKRPDYHTKGAAYQDWHGRGGSAMVQWLGEVLVDEDGIPAATQVIQ